MPLDLDRVQFSSTIPAYTNVSRGTFTIAVSGTIAASATATFSGSASQDTTQGSIKVYISQDVTPVDSFTDYLAGAYLPVPPAGSTYSPLVNNACSVVGEPGVASISLSCNIRLTTTGVAATLSITNPYAGTMTLTATTYTFHYSVFAPTYIV